MKKSNKNALRSTLYDIIFGTESFPGKTFDTVLIALIIINTISVMLESVSDIDLKYKTALHAVDFISTLFFTIEYILRVYSAKDRIKYATGFFGIVDLLAILPIYIALIIPQSRFLLTIRLLRILRIFRIFKMASYITEAEQLIRAIKTSYRRIIVFILFILTLVSILGSVMYVVEYGSNGFTSIPKSIYWAVVTLTTVGYGDISPATPAGRFIAAVIMLMGYSLIVVPTGFVASSMHWKNKYGLVNTKYIRASLLKRTIDFWENDLRRIDHSLEVLHHSEEIAKNHSGVDYRILWAVSLLHDVGIKPAEEKFGYNTAILQERYGPDIARDILSDFPFEKDTVEKICKIIETHHSPTDLKWPELIILKKADAIVNSKISEVLSV